jgi:hypothetical protein
MDGKYVRPEIRPTGLKAFESVGWRESSKHDGGGSKQPILLYEDTFIFLSSLGGQHGLMNLFYSFCWNSIEYTTKRSITLLHSTIPQHSKALFRVSKLHRNIPERL